MNHNKVEQHHSIVCWNLYPKWFAILFLRQSEVLNNSLISSVIPGMLDFKSSSLYKTTPATFLLPNGIVLPILPRPWTKQGIVFGGLNVIMYTVILATRCLPYKNCQIKILQIYSHDYFVSSNHKFHFKFLVTRFQPVMYPL